MAVMIATTPSTARADASRDSQTTRLVTGNAWSNSKRPASSSPEVIAVTPAIAIPESRSGNIKANNWPSR